MAKSAADLQQLKGVGAVLAKRIFDAGFDTFDKLAQAGEEGLKKIPGIPSRAIASIVEQARQRADVKPEASPERKEAIKRHLLEVRQRVEALAQSARERFQQKLAGKQGKKLSSDLIRMEDALTQMDSGGKKQSKRAEKALTKAEKRIAGLDEAGLKKVHKGLKKARKAVLRAG